MSEKEKWVQRFSVDETSKHKNGFTIYKITSVIFPIESPEAVTCVSVWKRYSDIQKLHKNMKSLHQALHLKGTIPTFKNWSFFKRFDEEVIEDRKTSIKALMEFVAEHRLLFTSAEFVNFLESGYPEPEQSQISSTINEIRSALQLPVEDAPPIEYQSDEDTKSLSYAKEQSNKPKTDLEELTDFNISEIEIFEAADIEIRPSTVNISKTDSFDSISSLESTNDDFYDEVMKVDLKKTFKSIKNKSVLPDLINFDEPSTSKFDDYHTMRVNKKVDPDLSTVNKTVDLSNKPSTSYEISSNKRTFEDVIDNRTTVKQKVDPMNKTVVSPIKSTVNKKVDDFNRSTVKKKVEEDNSESDSLKSSSFSDLSRTESRLSTYSKRSYSFFDSKNKTEDSYIFEAGYMFNLAARCEDMGDFTRAFDCYKLGIEKMLNGVQSDSDQQRKRIIKEKTTKYLTYAENIYRNHLCHEEQEFVQDSQDWSLNTTRCALPISMLKRPYEELNWYRVLAILHSNAMLVLHKDTGQCYAMKVIQKIPNNLTEFDEYFSQKQSETKQPILPTNVPYMVQLNSFIETPNLIFLILQYAPGGKLLDYIKNYVKSVPNTPAREVNLENVFSEPQKNRHDENRNRNNENRNNKSDSEGSDAHMFVDRTVDCNYNENRLISEIERTESERGFDSINKNENKLKHDENRITIDTINSRGDQENENSKTESRGLEKTEFDLNSSINKVDISVNDLVINSQRLLLNVDSVLKEKPIVSLEKSDVDEKKADENITRGKQKRSIHLAIGKEEDQVKKSILRKPTANMMKDFIPPSSVCKWGAELLTAIEYLHNAGVICRDLNPNNLLLGDRGQLILTYFVGFESLDVILSILQTKKSTELNEINLYVAPELYRNTILEMDMDSGENQSEMDKYPEMGRNLERACDFWSFGAIMYELLCGVPLSYYHRSMFTSHTMLEFPPEIPLEVNSLLTQLLTYKPVERLGSGKEGIEEIKKHPYFKNIVWNEIYEAWIAPD